MTKRQLIAYLRQSCIVQDPEVTPNDPAFLSLTDEELELVLNVALSKESPFDSIENIMPESIYPVILLAKKELYYQLATKSAPLYKMSLGEDGGLSKEQRFEHYLALIQEVEAEYKHYKETGTVVNVGEILLSSRYYTRRNYNLATPPTCNLIVDLVTDTYVELSWSVRNINRFYSYVLYISENPIVDLYNPNSPIKGRAKKVIELRDIHFTKYRIENLKPFTKYYVCLVVQEANGLKGFSEVSFTTQFEGDEDANV